MLKDLLTRSAWLVAGSAAGRLLPLAVLIWASRHFEAQQYASASAGFAWAGIAMSLTSTGEATVMTQRMGRESDVVLRRGLFVRHARRALLLSAALAVVVCTCGGAGVRALFGDAVGTAVVVPAALAGVLWSQVGLAVAALNGSHAARRAALTLAMCGLSQGLAMLGALHLLDSARAMVWGLAGGSALALALAWRQVREELGPLLAQRAAAAQAVRQRLGYVALKANPVVWNTLATVSVLPVTFFASSLVARGPDGTRQLAQYFALEQLHQVLVYLPAIVGQALLPMVSRQIGDPHRAAAAAGFLRRMAQLALLSAVGGAALALLLGWGAAAAVPWLRNPSVQPQDAPAVQAMLVNAALALSLSLLGGAYVGSGRIVTAALLNLLWGGVMIAGTAAWMAHGNLGLQVARVLASASLIAIGTLLLHHIARRLAAPSPESSHP